ncbi:MAG: hypothetical protein D3M94_07345 [Rhodocyclales bacterium GT-UBC]|nr:MAG: hypothetical protein D3M94_07345 [Rhodocyclales bacterium GT-UBC]
MMDQHNESNRGQTTQSGDIIVCNGASNCPLSKEKTERESSMQAAFYRDTGIWAPPGARWQLERLMQNGFTAPKLRVAWQGNNLQLASDDDTLIVKTHWFEPFAGYFLVAIMCFYLLVETGTLLMVRSNDTVRMLLAFAAIFAMYGGTTWMAVRFILMPYWIARRVQIALKLSDGHRRFKLLDTIVGMAKGSTTPGAPSKNTA